MTPSQVCYDPEYIKKEVYEVLLKAMSHRFKSEADSEIEQREAARSRSDPVIDLHS